MRNEISRQQIEFDEIDVIAAIEWQRNEKQANQSIVQIKIKLIL
jgi:hypothetical protein